MDHIGPDKFVQAIRADPGDRLLTRPRAQNWTERRQLAILFAVFLVFHVGLLGIVIAIYGIGDPIDPEQEIAVEVVQQPPEPPSPEPPPPEQQAEKKPQEQPKPPPQLDMKPAYDAPRAPNDEKLDRDAPDKETATPNVAPPSEEAAAKAQTKPSDAPKATPAPDPGPQSERAALDKPDAEAIEKAEVKPDEPKPSTSPEAAATPSAGTPLFMKALANLKPIPDYKFSGASKPAPVSGGNAKTSYLSILYGLIMPHMRVPSSLRGKAQGAVVIYIDTAGHVLHMGVVDPSGSVELDNAAIAAVREAGTFPPPPAGLPPVRFTYGTQQRQSSR